MLWQSAFCGSSSNIFIIGSSQSLTTPLGTKGAALMAQIHAAESGVIERCCRIPSFDGCWRNRIRKKHPTASLPS
ncbi:hypothetical protein O181_103485 [Austropuccinia psidii MF-1]|uniref:Uncharacterized protein n=1 Tax=Austropuccinia psidii MF-1 TaxID=1389203 RepID=A0A9Q3JLP7_9BASI|nr:hypothetical protein [Austropuccinia psidii MF-1]